MGLLPAGTKRIFGRTPEDELQGFSYFCSKTNRKGIFTAIKVILEIKIKMTILTQRIRKSQRIDSNEFYEICRLLDRSVSLDIDYYFRTVRIKTCKKNIKALQKILERIAPVAYRLIVENYERSFIYAR